MALKSGLLGLPGLVVAVRAGDAPQLWHIEVRGLLDGAGLAAFKRFVLRTARRLGATRRARVVINLSGLRFTGEVVPARVGAILDGLAKGCRELKVISPNAAVRSLLEHCRPGLPRYECL